VRRLVLLLAVLGLLATVAAGSAQASPTWLPNAPISGADQPNDPVVGMNAAGDAVAAWYAYDEKTAEYLVSASIRPAGGTWGSPARYARGRFGGFPEVAISPTGDALLVFVHDDGGVATIEAAAASADGRWAPAQTISDPLEDAFEPTVAFDGAGEATALWTTGGVITAAYRTPLGQWTAPQGISAVGVKANEPRLAVDEAGDEAAIWVASKSATFIVEGSARPAGGAWRTPTELSAAGGNALAPDVAIGPGGRAVAGWVRNDGTAYIAQSSSLSSPTGSWEKPAADLSGQSGSLAVAVAVDARGDEFAVWRELEGANYVVRAAERPLGASWQPSTPISDQSTNASEPFLTVDPAGDATVVWFRTVGKELRTEAVRQPAGGAWGAPQVLGVGASWVRVAGDAGGDAIAVWSVDEGGVEEIRWAGLDVAGPALGSPQIPSAATVGVPVAFSVTPRDVLSPVAATTWDFGDGGHAASAAAGHTYSTPGTYTVAVESTDAVGNRTRATGTVTVTPAPGAGPRRRGKAHAARIVKVHGGKAEVRLRCGSAACRGVLKLVAKQPKAAHHRQPRRAHRRVVLGRSSFRLAAGGRKTIAVKLTKTARGRLAATKAGRLPARLEGTEVGSRAVVLVAASHRHGRGARH
jgi:hypothetical protein